MGRRRREFLKRFKLSSTNGVLLAILLLLVFAVGAVESRCRIEECASKYSHQMKDRVVEGPNVHYCSILRSYSTCIRNTARRCRGDLTYHGTSSLVISLNAKNNCSYILTSSKHRTRPNTNTRHGGHDDKVKNPYNPSSRYECAYRGKPKFRHCALFGDPHLRTFHDQFQTCTVKGAWPLIDNSYLAVQVTNGPVVDGFRATAPTKLTVIVKGHGPCMDEKTYEAQVDSLPAAFIDGTKMSDHSQSVVVHERVPGRHVEVHIRYIATVIVIRQIGSYLTFAIRIPEEVALRGAHHRLGLELCVRGCPIKERIEYNNFLAHPNRWMKSINGKNVVPALPKDLAILKCRKRNITDHYFDSCVFDLLTTGDISFLETAEMAQRDALVLHPNARATLKNRTHLLDEETFHDSALGGNNGAFTKPHCHLLIFGLYFIHRLILR